MDAVLRDTDILSEILRAQSVTVTNRAASYFQEHRQFSLSSITRYEIVRGLKFKGSATILAAFEAFCKRSRIIPVSDDVLDVAAELWASGRRLGNPRQDADLIIAATAIVHQLTLVTGNTTHFEWLPELKLDDWRATRN